MFASRLSARVLGYQSSKKNFSMLAVDESKTVGKYFHKSALALMGLAPVAFLFSPSSANFPVDLLLGIVIPFHSHVGLSHVVTDYAPKAMRTAARVSLLGCTTLLFAGLLKLNISGVGITETIKALWREPKNNKK